MPFFMPYWDRIMWVTASCLGLLNSEMAKAKAMLTYAVVTALIAAMPLIRLLYPTVFRWVTRSAHVGIVGAPVAAEPSALGHWFCLLSVCRVGSSILTLVCDGVGDAAAVVPHSCAPLLERRLSGAGRVVLFLTLVGGVEAVAVAVVAIGEVVAATVVTIACVAVVGITVLVAIAAIDGLVVTVGITVFVAIPIILLVALTIILVDLSIIVCGDRIVFVIAEGEAL
jgi:hypothetical protein